MANIISNNPGGCWKKEKVQDCKACYYAQVKDGQWKGSQRCWNSKCLTYGGQK